MIRRFFRYAIWLWTLTIAASGWSQAVSTLVRVVDGSGSKDAGIAGVTLLFNPGNSLNSFALITDAEGKASIPHLSCDICTVTAFDPRGLFFSKTSEFDGRSTSVTVTLEVQPVIDNVGDPRAVKVKIKVYGPNGELLPNQRVIVRPAVMTFEANWAYWETTDSMGLVDAELRPGGYVVAALNGENALEASIKVTRGMDEKKPVAVHLSRSCIFTRYDLPCAPP